MLIGKELGPFLIESELGSGAMGTVYKALNRKKGRYVAIKMIAEGLLGNETAVARFEREAKILEQLKHPNIVRLVGSGRYKKTPFIAMEFVEGESLDRVFARRSTFSWEEVAAIGKQLCEALQHAHLQGIIHRDVKPSNVMVLRDGTVKLADFGIAKDADLTAITGTKNTVGTAAYMSPEQCQGHFLTSKSDLYSLGVMFYELLTGRKPFITESPLEMFHAHVFGEFERPIRRVLTIPQALDTLVVQLLEKKPEQRPFDAAMVGRVLAEIEEKAIAQRSAGVDVVTARRIDRPGAPGAASEADRDAARALRAGLSKKKVRKKKRSFASGMAFRAGSIVAALLAIVGVIYFMTRPPSADALYQVAKSAVESKDEDRVIETTQRFVDVYPKLTGAQSEQIRTWRKEYWASKREKQLFNRFERKMVHDDEGQRISTEAMRNENEGETERADQLWGEMETKFQAAPDPEPAVYAWVARKKREDLKRIGERVQVLQEVIKAERLGREPEHKLDSEAERLSHTALRYQEFGDIPMARERWITVREQYIKPLDVRLWGILAAERVRTTPTMPPAEHRPARLKLLAQKIALAQKATANSDPTEKRESATICRDIVALYGRDPDPEIAAFARQAEQRLREIGAS